MIISSHKLRAEEKKLYHKLAITFILFLAALLLSVYIGLPLLAKAILTIGSFRQEKGTTNITSESFLFPPVLDFILEATNSSRTTITGLGEKETTVAIFVNDKEQVKVLTDKEGKFKTANILLTEGTNFIAAKTIKDGKESSSSSPLSITYKKSPPKLEINTPKEGEKLSEEKITILGETDPGNRVTINDRFVIVDQNGKFSFATTLSNGENTFKITATDIAGNQTTVERKVTYNPF